jgi:hypothetical protein
MDSHRPNHLLHISRWMSIEHRIFAFGDLLFIHSRFCLQMDEIFALESSTFDTPALISPGNDRQISKLLELLSTLRYFSYETGIDETCFTGAMKILDAHAPISRT